MIFLSFFLGSFSTTNQGTDRGTGILRFSEMETGEDIDTAKYLYQKGKENWCLLLSPLIYLFIQFFF